MKKFVLIIAIITQPYLLTSVATVALPKPKVDIYKQEMDLALAYKGYGERHMRKIAPHVSHVGELVICMVEGQGKVSKNNFSGFRGRKGYYKYATIKNWALHFRDRMENKFPRTREQNTKAWLKTIAPIYNPQHQEEWLKRCYYWCDLFMIKN